VAQQFTTWLTCQTCGRATLRQTAVGWLDSPRRTDPDVAVVRCPQHWSEWALRVCQAGRTKAMRQAMAEALKMPVPPIPVALGPYPTQEKWEE